MKQPAEPDSVNDHIAPKLGLYPGKSDETQWFGQCPVCKGNFSFRLGDKGFIWTCHRKSARGGRSVCTQALIKQAMIDRGVSPDLLRRAPGRHRKPGQSAETKRLVDFITSEKVPSTAMKIGLLRELGVGPAEARQRLRLKRSTYYDAMRVLGQSGFSDSAAGQDQSENPDSLSGQ